MRIHADTAQAAPIWISFVTDKSDLRREAIRARDLIVPGADDAERAADLFFEAVKPTPDKTVALYWPKGREFDTSALIDRLLKADVPCALPVMRPGTRVMKFARWKEEDSLIPGPFNVMQPADDERTMWVDPDIVVVPLLAFDRKGNRLGYGGGHYDATLGFLRENKNIIAIGLGFSQQAVLYNLPVEDHDQKLDGIVTQDRVRFF